MRYRAVLRLPFAEWSRAVDDGSIAQKRAAAKVMADYLNTVVAPVMNSALTEMLIYGRAAVRFDEDGSVSNVELALTEPQNSRSS